MDPQYHKELVRAKKRNIRQARRKGWISRTEARKLRKTAKEDVLY